MSLLLAALVVVTFAAMIERFGLVGHAREVVARSRESLDLVRDRSLDDDAKEKRLQRHAVRLAQLVVILAGGSLLALGLPLAGVWLLDLIGVGSLGRVLSVLQRIDFLAATMALGLFGVLLLRRTGRR